MSNIEMLKKSVSELQKAVKDMQHSMELMSKKAVKTKRPPNTRAIFMGKEMRRLREEMPGKTQPEYMKLASENWKKKNPPP